MTSDTTSSGPGHTRDSTAEAAGAARDLRDDAVREATSLKDRAVDEAARRADAAKDTVADEIGDMSDALRRASEELRDGSPQERTFGQLAGALADFSDSIRGKDIGEMAEDLSGLARRNPTAFLGGAALLGFAGVRLTKASQRNQHKAVDLADMWGTDDEDEEIEAALFSGASTYDATTRGGPAGGETDGIPGPATTPVADTIPRSAASPVRPGVPTIPDDGVNS